MAGKGGLFGVGFNRRRGGVAFRRCLVVAGAVIGGVESRSLEDQSRSPTNLTPGFRFATTRALLDRICFNRLKFFPQMIAGIALVVVGGHAAGS